MKSAKGVFQEVILALASAYLFFLAAWTLKLILNQPFPATLDFRWASTPIGRIVIYASAAITLVLALYFLVRLWGNIARRRRFSREGVQGPIQVAPGAIEDFIGGLLAEEVHLTDSDVVLNHAANGALDVRLTLDLPMNASVVETSERLQQQIKERVETVFGIQIHQVTVFARRMSPAKVLDQPVLPQLEGTSGPGADGDEPNEVKTHP